MEWKNKLTKTPYLVLFIVLLAVGVGTASAMITITLSGNVVITGDLDMTSDKIRNVASPTMNSDAATKGYVDSAPSTDTLALLGCSDEEIPKWDGSQWICSKDFQTWNSRVPTQNIITTVDSGTNVGLFTSITIGSDDLPVISYHDTINDELKVAKCHDPACISSTKTVVDSNGNVGGYSSIVIGTGGNPIISYYDFTNQDLKLLICGNLACSSGNSVKTVDSTDVVGLYPSITLNANGYPIISYYDSTNSQLKVATCTDSACSGSVNLESMPSGDDQGWYPSIIMRNQHRATIVHWDSDNDTLEYHNCSSDDCSGGSSGGLVRGSAGTYSSMTLGTDGVPVVSSYDSQNKRLLVSHLDLPTVTNTQVDTITTDVGTYTSISIGEDGNPVVSYYDFGNGDLKVAKCFDHKCEKRITSIIDSGGDVGRESSIAVPPDGLPVISYRDFTNGNLKVAKCGSPTCNENWIRR